MILWDKCIIKHVFHFVDGLLLFSLGSYAEEQVGYEFFPHGRNSNDIITIIITNASHCSPTAGGEPIKGTEYTGNGRVTEFKYGKYLGEAFRGNNQLRWLINFHEGWGMLHRDNSVVFIDNHDNQRGHGAGGDMILTFRVSRWYKVSA